MGPVGSVLFAAGRGVRLRPLSDLLPKAVVPILDIPLAAFALARLRWSAPPVVVNTSHLGDFIQERLGPPFSGEDVSFIDEGTSPPGSGGTLADVAAGVVRRVVTHNSDALTDLDPVDLLETHERSGAPATLAVARVPEGADLETDGTRVTRFVNRKTEAEAAGARFIGVAVFEKHVLDLIPEERPMDLARALLMPLAAAGELAVHLHDGYWIDVGTPRRFLRASQDALSAHRELLLKPPGEVRSVSGGTAYVGPDARTDAGALAPGAVVLAGAILGAGTVLENAVVWPGEKVPPGLHLTNCIWAGGGRLDI
ncbi:MAG: sugar phosphate nucleotidyltransferase [Actinomycetota bacterium]